MDHKLNPAASHKAEKAQKKSLISYHMQVISCRDVKEIIFWSVTVGRGEVSRWDNRNLQRISFF